MPSDRLDHAPFRYRPDMDQGADSADSEGPELGPDEMLPGIGWPADDDIFTNNFRFGDLADWNRAAVAIHEEHDGFYRIDRKGFPPVLAILDHAAVLEVERQPDLFTNGPAPVLTTQEALDTPPLVELKTLIHMDGDEHAAYRKLGLPQFKPASLSRLEGRLDELSERALTTMRGAGGEIDFSVEVALPYPLQVILKILGLPEEDYPRMMTLTQQLFGGEDPDLQREELTPEAIAAVLMDFFTYFNGITTDRREQPTDDLASLIANGTIGDDPLGDLETMGYYVIVATAGHDTTSSAMAGGFRALVEHPDQLRLLQERPELMNNAIEEMIRWTAPVRHFMRTATADTEVNGHQLAAGDMVYLSYKGANLDPKVFDDPLRFDIERPNADRQISFGFGKHFCMGAQLARMELRSLFSRIVPMIESVELAGTPTTSQTTFVGGHKTLPIRYTMRDG
jgi:cytochrome P450